MNKLIRKNEVKQALLKTALASQKELLPTEELSTYLDFQSALLKIVFEENHQEYYKLPDLIRHLRQEAEMYGLIYEDAFVRLEEELQKMEKYICGMIKGKKGELQVSRALKLLSSPCEIIQNVQLSDKDGRTEYDSIVITSKGIFLLEVKNNRNDMIITKEGNYIQKNAPKKAHNYNIAINMNCKEYLLKKNLEEKFGDKLPPIYQILVFSNYNAQIIDDYKLLPICYCSDLVHYITNRGEEDVLNIDEILKYSEYIKCLDQQKKYPVRFNMYQIIEDFTEILIELEECADFLNNDETVDYSEVYSALGIDHYSTESCKEDFESNDAMKKTASSRANEKERKSAKSNIGIVAAALAAIAAGFSAVSIMKRK